MDWKLTVDRTWFLHFSDQLFNWYNFLTVCPLSMSYLGFAATAVFCRLIFRPISVLHVRAVVAVPTLILCRLQQFAAIARNS